jgi:hypothetical protein
MKREGCFLRTVTGLIARLMTEARKGAPAKMKFWSKLAYTRVLEWGRAFRFAVDYVILNEMEAQGAWRREWEPSRRKKRGFRA